MADDDELQRIRETLRRAGVDESRLSDDQLVLVVARLMAQPGEGVGPGVGPGDGGDEPPAA